MNEYVKTLLKILIDLVIAFGILIIIQSQIMTLTRVYQWSMFNTLSEGDLLLTEKVTYRLREPKRGEVIILLEDKPKGVKGTRVGILVEDYIIGLKNEEARTRYVKRIIGLPGDVVTMENGKVYINGEELEENYVLGKTTSNSLMNTVLVPKDHVFVLGDNRERSLDSRYFGCIPFEHIESKVAFRIWPNTGLIKK